MQTIFEWGRLQMKARDKPGFVHRKFNKRHSWGFRSISTKHSGVGPDGLTDIRSRRPKTKNGEIGRWEDGPDTYSILDCITVRCYYYALSTELVCLRYVQVAPSLYNVIKKKKKKKLWPVHSTENRLSITLETEFNKLIKRGATLRSQLSHDDYQINYGTKKLLSPLVSNNYLNHYTKLLKYNICWTLSTSESKYSIKQFHNKNGYFLFCAQKANISIINTNHQIVTIVQ